MTSTIRPPSVTELVQRAIAAGERDPVRLTDGVFNARHPERRGRRIGPGEQGLAREWTQIRDGAVMPALRRPAPVIAPPAPVAPAPTPTSRYVLPPDPEHLRPPARAQIAAQPLLLAEEVFRAEAELVRTIASRPDGFLYMTNWYMDINLDLQLQPPETLAHLLASCATKGGRIRTILWDATLRQFEPLLSQITSPVTSRIVREAIASKYLHEPVNRAAAGFINRLFNGIALLDDDTQLAGSHHQKILVAMNSERIAAVVGGVEWSDTRTLAKRGGTPYFDISVQLDGQAAADVADLFEQRWTAAGGNKSALAPRRPPPARPTGRGATVQVGANYGCGAPMKKIPHAVRGGSQLIENLFRNCRSFFYAEDQYGMGNADLKAAISQAFQNGASYGVVVLATKAGVDDNPEVDYWRYQFWSQFRSLIGTRLFVFERMGDDSNPAWHDPEGPHAYVHSKLVLVDDQAVSIGSLNLNARSWYNDSEFTAVVADAPELIRDLRLKIWGRHLWWPAGNVDRDIRDPLAAKTVWQEAYAGTHPRPFLKPVTFATPPKRQSDQMPTWFNVLRAAGGLITTYMSDKDIDAAMSAAHFLIFDRAGPSRC
jgi:phosphatidylserine/phosphatidylglycerophosphate/cardiolipin synthase-like enzyme